MDHRLQFSVLCIFAFFYYNVKIYFLQKSMLKGWITHSGLKQSWRLGLEMHHVFLPELFTRIKCKLFGRNLNMADHVNLLVMQYLMEKTGLWFYFSNHLLYLFEFAKFFLKVVDSIPSCHLSLLPTIQNKNTICLKGCWWDLVRFPLFYQWLTHLQIECTCSHVNIEPE